MWEHFRFKPRHKAALRDLADPDCRARIRALDAIGDERSADEETLSAVRRALTDSSEDVSAAATSCLVRLGDHGAINLLMEQAQQSSATARVSAVAALGGLGDLACVPVLQARLSDEEPEVRMHAAVSLAELEGASAAPMLVSLLKDEDAEVRAAAAAALGDVCGELGVFHLVACLDDEDEDVQAEAAYSLARLGRADGLPILSELVLDQEWGFGVCEVLGRLGDPRAVAPLEEAWRSVWAHPIIRARAAASLWQLGKKEALDDLQARARSLRFSVRSPAIALLGEVGGPGTVEVLAELLKRKRSASDAASALGELKDPSSAQLLDEALERWARCSEIVDAIQSSLACVREAQVDSAEGGER